MEVDGGRRVKAMDRVQRMDHDHGAAGEGVWRHRWGEWERDV